MVIGRQVKTAYDKKIDLLLQFVDNIETSPCKIIPLSS